MFFPVSISDVWSSFVRLYTFLIFVYVLMSWIRDAGPFESVRRVLAVVCEPYLGLFRRVLPTAWMGSTGMDFSPMVALVVLTFIIGPVVSAILRTVGL